MKCFANAKEGATAKNDTKTIDKINGVIDSYYNKLVTEEMEMVDPEDNDYSYVVEACENALAANPNNPRALYHLAIVSNKTNNRKKPLNTLKKLCNMNKKQSGCPPLTLSLDQPIRAQSNMTRLVLPFRK